MENIVWNNHKDADLRRRCIFEETPSNWRKDKRLLCTAIALEKISNTLKDKEERRKAKRDSDYYYKQLQELKGIGE